MKAVLIARVSTDEQKDALPAQVYRLEDYANSKAFDYELIKIRESAYKGSRNEFAGAIAKIGEIKASILVFDKIDRLTRDYTSDEVKTVQDLWRDGDIELHFPSDNLIIHKDSPATDIMRLGLGFVMAQYYSDAISDTVKRRLEQKLRDGECIGMAPFGYKNTIKPGGSKWVEINDIEAEAVKMAYTLYASGTQSLKTIKQKLANEFGIKNRSTSQLDLILKNPFYYGEMRVKGTLYPHKYEPIISKELFERVEAVRNGYHVKPHRWAGLPYIYRSLVKCAECGCTITFEKKKGKYIYGHCTQFKGKHDAAWIREEDLTRQLQKCFDDIHIPIEKVHEVSAVLRKHHEDKKAMRNQSLSHLEAEISKYQNRLEKIYEDYLDGNIPETLYERKFSEYRERQKSLQDKRDNVELLDDDYYGSISHLLKLANNAKSLFLNATSEQKRSLINIVLQNLFMTDRQLLWQYRKPFDLMAFCTKNQNWLRRPDSNRRPSA